MSVNVGATFVRARDPHKLTAFIESYLTAPAAGNPDLLDENGRRRVVVLPAVRGWTTVLESQESETDPGLAAAVAREIRDRVVRLVVRGGVFDYYYERYEDGSSTESGQLLTAAQTMSAELPDFQDAEVIAWSHALRMGIPTETLFLRTRDVVDEGKAPPPGEAAGVRFEAGVDGGRWRLRRTAVALRPGAAVREARVHLDLAEREPKSGKVALAVEHRRLWGEPTPAAVDRLVTLLRRVRERYAWAFEVSPLCIRFCVWAGERGAQWVALPADIAGPRPDEDPAPSEPLDSA